MRESPSRSPLQATERSPNGDSETQSRTHLKVTPALRWGRWAICTLMLNRHFWRLPFGECSFLPLVEAKWAPLARKSLQGSHRAGNDTIVIVHKSHHWVPVYGRGEVPGLCKGLQQLLPHTSNRHRPEEGGRRVDTE